MTKAKTKAPKVLKSAKSSQSKPKPAVRKKLPAVALERIAIAGLFDNVPATAYHRDPCPEPSASASILHTIHESSTAHAWLEHPRLNPNFVDRAPTAEKDFGSAAHVSLLDKGLVHVIPERDWRKDDAKIKRKVARSIGAAPILSADWQRIQDMTGYLRRRLAGSDLGDVFDPKRGGYSEVTAAWLDSGLWNRARADRWIPPESKMLGAPNGLIVDYKTTGDLATAEVWSTKLYSLGGDFQSVFYPHGFAMARSQSGIMTNKVPRFVFIVQEWNPPFAFTILEPDEIAIQHATNKLTRAYMQWSESLKRGKALEHWPDYPRRIAYFSPPPWELSRDERALLAAGVLQSPL